MAALSREVRWRAERAHLQPRERERVNDARTKPQHAGHHEMKTALPGGSAIIRGLIVDRLHAAKHLDSSNKALEAVCALVVNEQTVQIQ